MARIDRLTLMTLALGIAVAAAGYFIFRRSGHVVGFLPRLLGIGGGVYLLIALTVASAVTRPASEISDYMFTNLILSVLFGTVAYVAGRMLARRFK